MKIKILIQFKKLYLNNKKQNKLDGYITFGSLNVKIDNNSSYLFLNNNYNKINLNNIYHCISLLNKKDKNIILKNERNSIQNYRMNSDKCEHIMFGSLKIDITKKDKNNKYINSKVTKKKDNLEIKLKHDNNVNKDIEEFLPNNKLEIKKENDLTDLNFDLYYVFIYLIYLIYLIFKNYNIKFIKDEIYNCLGEFGVQYYLSQYITCYFI